MCKGGLTHLPSPHPPLEWLWDGVQISTDPASIELMPFLPWISALFQEIKGLPSEGPSGCWAISASIHLGISHLTWEVRPR